jgi:DNA-binding MarR family transcriptional regulator
MSYDESMEEALAASTGFLLARLGAESRRRWGRMLAAHQLTPHHFAALMALDHLGTAAQHQVGELIGVDPRNTVAVIEPLHRRGLVDRGIDPANRRRHRLSLTDDGAALLARLRAEGDAVEDEMLAGLSVRQRAELHALLAALADQVIGSGPPADNYAGEAGEALSRSPSPAK